MKQLDVSTVVSFLSPDMMASVGDMLQLAIMSCDRPPKAIAKDIGYSVDSIYSAMKGARHVPAHARQKLSSVNCIAAAAVALEATGFTRLFGYQKVDRHVQSMIVRLKVKDRKTSSMLESLPELLVDKHSPGDLSPEEKQQLYTAVCSLAELTNSHLNLIMELETRYDLRVTQFLQGKEKTAHQRAAN